MYVESNFLIFFIIIILLFLNYICVCVRKQNSRSTCLSMKSGYLMLCGIIFASSPHKGSYVCGYMQPWSVCVLRICAHHPGMTSSMTSCIPYTRWERRARAAVVFPDSFIMHMRTSVVYVGYILWNNADSRFPIYSPAISKPVPCVPVCRPLESTIQLLLSRILASTRYYAFIIANQHHAYFFLQFYNFFLRPMSAFTVWNENSPQTKYTYCPLYFSFLFIFSIFHSVMEIRSDSVFIFALVSAQRWWKTANECNYVFGLVVGAYTACNIIR